MSANQKLRAAAIIAGMVLVSPMAGSSGNGLGDTNSFKQFGWELHNDEKMWEATTQVLSNLGYQSTVETFDNLWRTTRTPQQWTMLQPGDWDRYKDDDRKLAGIVNRCQAAGTIDLAIVFQNVCRSGRPLADLFAGMALWTEEGAAPRLQNSTHYALHFIYGGASQAGVGVGYAAAIGKELHDEASGGDFNLDEMGAAMAGAEWVHRAREDPDWVNQWATGQKNCTRNLPRFHYGIGHYSATMVEKIRSDILVAFDR